MALGKIASLRKKQNWGFIEEENESKVYFSHMELVDVKFPELKVNDRISYEIAFKEDGKTYAKGIQRLLDVPNKPSVSVKQLEHHGRNPAALVKQLVTTCLEREIAKVKAGIEFEQLTFLLLRLLGIHTLYQYDPEEQSGRADGFFICDRLAVMYDCTLRQNFEVIKKAQIENYINKMCIPNITIDVKTGEKTSIAKTYNIQRSTCQIWIITKGESCDLSEVDGVAVREVSIMDLVSLLEVKLNTSNFKETDLVEYLLDFGRLAAN